MPWQDSWDQAQHYDGTDRTFRQINQFTNPLAYFYGKATGGNFDPISQGLHGQYGSAAKNAAQIAWQKGDEMVYSQMDKAQWDELAQKEPDYQRNWIETRKRWLLNGKDDNGNPVKPGKFYNPQTGQSESGGEINPQDVLLHRQPGQGGDAGVGAQVDPLTQQIQDFYRHMTGPLDMNDPEVKQAIATGVNSVQRSTNASGVKGGLSDQAIARGAMGAQTQLAAQRRQQGLSALGMLDARDRGQAGLGLQAQGQFFDQNQSNSINSYNRNRADQQQQMAIMGQGLSFLGGGGLSSFGKSGGGQQQQGGFQQGGQNTPNYNGGGYEGANTQYGGSLPTDWSDPYKGE